MNDLNVCDRRTGSSWLVIMLCVCVLVQMLGMPVTLLSLLTPGDMFTESICEDPSITPFVPEVCPLSFRAPHIDGHLIRLLPLFATSVFHPPQS